MKGVTPYDLARRFVGVEEVEGVLSNPQILAWLQHEGHTWVKGDDVPWCSAFASWIAWLADVARPPKADRLRARSWLLVGRPINIADATPGYDVVVLKRGGPNEPGPEVINANGHVGFFAGLEGLDVKVLGGNQADMVNVSRFPRSQVLAVRRIA